MAQSDAILARLGKLHPKVIDLSLGRITRLLEKLGNPHLSLPPVIHIAGTNGKGSTLAYLRAIYEAAGLRVHCSTSPHLVKFHERITLAGNMISEDALCDLLTEVETVNNNESITFFEITQAAAFLAFSRVPADVLLLETGLGGRVDASNVLEKPAATVITPISLDHQGFLGDTIAKIAFEKAGIMKHGVPCITAPQSLEAFNTLACHANSISAPIFNDFEITKEDDDGFTLRIGTENIDLPHPALPGRHQYTNAATAIATVRKAAVPGCDGMDVDILARGLTTARWPARLQKLTTGPLCDALPDDCELILDGGHNIAAAEAIADWLSRQPAGDTVVIMGMLDNRDATAFLKPIAPHITAFAGVPIPGEHQDHKPETLRDAALACDITPAFSCDGFDTALASLLHSSPDPKRVLILGSLYLAGLILENHG
ncbi:bifunctional folylpolyglutamate synthase/dihydrofolate synthase [Thalassospira australica]|uniref:bifunctional folylpolyglutamate synthase/dihydrofolate synthase n=1 Tax=Thalassospira australica TaxID=1528106 RepID=UPI00068C1E42|nr:folylpolyglutamate synthase/dihydrofolate synthase family protein [Thalassospira australica]